MSRPQEQFANHPRARVIAGVAGFARAWIARAWIAIADSFASVASLSLDARS
jgi:hypothetical protein